MGHAVQLLRRASNQITRLVGMYRGESFPFYYVSEYPRSGGTWLGKMVADCLEVDFPRLSVFPAGVSCIVHNHWGYHPRYRRVIYLYRDGRDVMVSMFFQRMRRLAARDPRTVRLFEKRFEQYFGEGYDPNDSVGLLPAFMRAEFDRPLSARLTWPQHIEAWHDPDQRPHVTYVSYEELLNDCRATLARVVEQVSGRAVDPWIVDNAVERYSMAKQTGRKPGEEDRGSFIRKGVAGDWTNHFTPAAAQLFDEFAGDALVRLGYETDRDWVSRYDLADDPGAGTGEAR